MKNQFLMSDSEKSRILSLHESSKHPHGTSLLNEDTGQSDIMDKALTGDFLRSTLDTQELFNKISKLQPNLSYQNFLKWGDKKTTSRIWGICKDQSTDEPLPSGSSWDVSQAIGCGGCARTLKKGGRTNENGECMEDVINFVRQKGNIQDLYTKFK